MSKNRIIGIGETVFDILFKNNQPQKAVPGGSTFNSIVSLGRAGMNCIMVTEAGGDHVGDLICNFLQVNGVSAEYVCRHENVQPHISLAFLDGHNDAQYVFYKDHASVSLDGKLPEISKDDVVLFGSFFAINPMIRPVVGGLLRKAHGAGDNFNAGYIYAKMQGIDDPTQRIDMAQRWSQDVCQQLGNNISDELVEELKNERI